MTNIWCLHTYGKPIKHLRVLELNVCNAGARHLAANDNPEVGPQPNVEKLVLMRRCIRNFVLNG